MVTMEPKQRGEWLEVGGRVTGHHGAPVDVTGKRVTLVVRTGPTASAPTVEVREALGWVVDGPSGDVAAGGRIDTPGTYYGTVQVGEDADGPRWPVKDPVKITIVDCA